MSSALRSASERAVDPVAHGGGKCGEIRGLLLHHARRLGASLLVDFGEPISMSPWLIVNLVE